MGNGHYDDAQRRRAAEEEPTQQSMRERTKPVERRNPSADQKRVRRQMRREADVQTVPDSMEQTHTRTVTDDADFDPYLVTRCSDCGETRVCGDRTSQEHYIGAAQQCHNEAGHPDPRRRRSHSRDHLYDGSSCWSCGDDGYYVARPGERESGRTAKRRAMGTTAGSGGLVDEPEVRHHDPAKSWNVADGEGEVGTDTQAAAPSATPSSTSAKAHDCEKDGYHRYSGGEECLSCGHTRKQSALSCRACGHCGQGRGTCALCGSTAVVAEMSKQATQFDRNVATSDGRVLINPGEQIRTPTGQTVTVNNVRRHETSRDHYYLDTDMGTTLVPWSTNFQVVPSNTRQQELPGYGNPGGNANEMPFTPQDRNQPGQQSQPGQQRDQNQRHQAPNNQAPQGSKCPVCGGNLQQRGSKYQCSRCGYTDQYGGPGDKEFSNATQRFVSSKRDTRSAIARRATEVLDQMKETPL